MIRLFPDRPQRPSGVRTHLERAHGVALLNGSGRIHPGYAPAYIPPTKRVAPGELVALDSMLRDYVAGAAQQAEMLPDAEAATRKHIATFLVVAPDRDYDHVAFFGNTPLSPRHGARV